MEPKSEGICRFCLKTFSGSAMGRHLLSCKAKKERDAQEAATVERTYPIYHIRISSSKWYWLHIEMKATSTLSDLDQFLRSIWLECCGHLSEFTIYGVRYEESPEQDDFSDFFGEKSRSTNVKLGKVLGVKDKFEYEYDFGSTTWLEGQVLAVREGALSEIPRGGKERVRILARNNPYHYECKECGQQATDICLECDCLFCEDCLIEHECGEDMALPVVNSPRMGVCGYTGDYDPDDFSVEEAK